MLENSKVIWSEGMFLQPQHFQQQTQYLEQLIIQHATAFNTYAWGVAELTINQQLLSLGKFSISSCQGILPDGTLFNIPAQDLPTNVVDISKTLQNQIVYLAIPLQRLGVPEATLTEGNTVYRYAVQTSEVFDSNAGFNKAATLQLGKLACKLLLESEDRGGYSCLPIARIKQVTHDGMIILDTDYIPPCLNIQIIPTLKNFLIELLGLFHNRGNALVKMLAVSSNLAEVSNFMLLQSINRFQVLFEYLVAKQTIAPENFYMLLLDVLGTLAIFTRKRQPNKPVIYQHDDLENTFKPLIEEIRQALSIVLQQNATLLPLENRNHGLWVAPIEDRVLLKEARVVLAVSANISPEILRARFPVEVKVASAEDILYLVSRALPGIQLLPIATVPRQIPYQSRFTYFWLDQEKNDWKKLEKASAIAFHIGDAFPHLEMELWAIRDDAND